MVQFSLRDGKKVPPVICERLAFTEKALSYLEKGETIPEDAPDAMPRTLPDCAAEMADCHARLCQVIAPAKPRTIMLMEEERVKDNALLFLGPVPLVRQMMLVSLGSLALLLLISLSPCVNGSAKSFDFLKSSGMELLQNYLFLISAAGLGASFSALFQTNKFVANVSFDPLYNQSYWNRFLLGVMAGLIMAFFIPIEEWAGPGSNLRGMGKPLIAILGGFSSSAVHTILSRIVTTMESLFKGDRSGEARSLQADAAATIQREKNNTRMELAGQLSGLQTMMAGKEVPKEVKDALDKIQHGLYTGGSSLPPQKVSNATISAKSAPKEEPPPKQPPPEEDAPKASKPEDGEKGGNA